MSVNSPASPPAVLTIAGSDSGGGAGIQADLKTFMAHATYGLSAVVALTAQNTQSVQSVFAVPPSMISDQLDAVFSDISIKAAKTGMLMDCATIEAVVNAWKRNAPGIPLVVDPVMVATSGGRLLKEDAIDALRQKLLPLATLVTPNLREAEVLLDMPEHSIETTEEMQVAGREIGQRFGVPVVVVKGGHLANGPIVDVVFESKSQQTTCVENPRVASTSTHGTGCTLSAAIAANLAKDMAPLDAVRYAIKYVNQAIQAAYPVGHGHGPVNHAYALTSLAIPPPTVQTPYPFTAYLKAHSNGLWDKYIRHAFVRQAGTGTLRRPAFIYYLKQDYIYLKHYARTNALAAFKSDTMREIGGMADIALGCARESELHVKMCSDWGISREEMENEQESWASVAYTRYILDKGTSSDLLELLVAMYPCLLGYGEAAVCQAEDPETVTEGNEYWPWISNYADAHFQDAVRKGRQQIEDLVQQEQPSQARLNRLLKTFVDTTALEIKFWDSALEV